MFMGMYFVTGCLGITLSYHRQLSHRSFTTPKWVEYVLAYCGVMAVQGDPLEWVSGAQPAVGLSRALLPSCCSWGGGGGWGRRQLAAAARRGGDAQRSAGPAACLPRVPRASTQPCSRPAALVRARCRATATTTCTARRRWTLTRCMRAFGGPTWAGCWTTRPRSSACPTPPTPRVRGARRAELAASGQPGEGRSRRRGRVGCQPAAAWAGQACRCCAPAACCRLSLRASHNALSPARRTSAAAHARALQTWRPTRFTST